MISKKYNNKILLRNHFSPFRRGKGRKELALRIVASRSCARVAISPDGFPPSLFPIPRLPLADITAPLRRAPNRRDYQLQPEIDVCL